MRGPTCGSASRRPALPTLRRRRHMAVDTHELKERLMASDHEYRELSTRHHELDERLHELSSRPPQPRRPPPQPLPPPLPDRTRASRRITNQETETPSQGQDGGHRPPVS